MLEEFKRLWISLLRHSSKTRFQKTGKEMSSYSDTHWWSRWTGGPSPECTGVWRCSYILTGTDRALSKSHIKPEPVGINFCLVCCTRYSRKRGSRWTGQKYGLSTIILTVHVGRGSTNMLNITIIHEHTYSFGFL